MNRSGGEGQLGAAAEPPFELQERHIWLMPGEAGTPASIGHMILAVGLWEGGGWQLEEI